MSSRPDCDKSSLSKRHQVNNVPRLSRSGSQLTLDSIDFASYSEDGATGEEHIAVLEFELRKAKETINILRNNLTVAVGPETSTPNKESPKNIKPHEQRALNFLLNEYLMAQGYKLTSITFADENQSQDFDDWDDVGLNIAKPSDLLTLFREGFKKTGIGGVNAFMQTDFDADVVDKDELLKEQECEVEKLKSKVYFLEADLSELKIMNSELQKENDFLRQRKNETESPQKSDSISSDIPDQFEVIDKNMTVFKKKDFDDSISNNSFNASDWTNLTMPTVEKDISKERNFDNLSKESYAQEVYSICGLNLENTSINSVLNEPITSDDLVHIVTQSVSNIIPNIILNKREEAIPLLMSAIYLNPKATERDKLLQQLFNLKKKPTETERLVILSGIVGIAKCSGVQMVENEVLPQCWLQLTHKYIERRLLVVEACTVLIPYVSSPIRNSLILSMLQQMLEDKEDSVREKVIKALALLVSVCEDRDKYHQCEQLAFNTLDDSSFSVINLSTQILFPVLAKWALDEGCLTSSLFKKLLHKLNEYIKVTESQAKSNQTTDKIHRIVAVLDNLLPFLLMLVARHENVINNIEKDMVMEIRPGLLKLCTSLTNPEKFTKSDLNCGMILYEFDKYICDNPNVSWNEMDWVIDIMLPDLFNNLNNVDIIRQSTLECFLNLLSHIYVTFGKSFTKYKIRPLLYKKIQNLEQVISSFNQFCPSLNIIPVYLTMLTFVQDYQEISATLKKFLCALPLCGTPLDCLEISVRKLCEVGLQETVIGCLWTGVVHRRPLVKSAAAALFSVIIGLCDQELLKTKITSGIVTLANDNDILVKTATIPALGSLITDCSVKEIHDKAYLQLQTFAADTALRQNHTLLRQLIVTFGVMVNSSSELFRNDVILPHLSSLAAYTSQMTNQTRKIDTTVALLEAFTYIVYSPLNKQSISAAVKPGLRCLDMVIAENPSLSVHHETVLSMIRECDNKMAANVPNSPVEQSHSARIGQNVNQGVEEMRQRMSKIFNKSSIPKPNTLSNFQGIFKKK